MGAVCPDFSVAAKAPYSEVLNWVHPIRLGRGPNPNSVL